MSPSDELLENYFHWYQQSISHPLTNELCAGTLPDFKLFTYLVQDLKYFETGADLISKTMRLSDSKEASSTIYEYIGGLSTENKYFHVCIHELKQSEEVQKRVPHMLGENSETLPAVKKYIDYLDYLLNESNSYVELITVVYIMEKVYLGWVEFNLQQGSISKSLEYKHQEWIDLHSGEDFEKWVKFLAQEVDRVAPSDMETFEQTAKKTLELEVEFFEDCYNYNS
ncbi:hypothetical protein PSN45_003238 [Yamadazyma tenuis]|uniref:Heme oxygenase-like protein n=1 Tax=Candida tenuis (strain ATCC 10573 / BCRC 21748 / CBS 615 / JCM 9827 / NBRC 10315 / NRRL Y-1498 / VKM Y-70) TaxID=590646 RepID=G3AYX7_CANTC|nr:heme oxygenase-like protein [Yamadazyma tenuis ATCC 10573]EGV65956.1 heme oxygenase-like protein [Yamadazyma tenuis ATCC 10573]WEJ95711.1 hypothetical protein PSN45_003238 [Yamadazyma tenuis]